MTTEEYARRINGAADRGRLRLADPCDGDRGLPLSRRDLRVLYDVLFGPDVTPAAEAAPAHVPRVAAHPATAPGLPDLPAAR